MTDDPKPLPRGGDGRSVLGLDAGEIASLTGGQLIARSNRLVRGAAVDSRAVQPGNLFVALPGERTDGHRFLGDAVARGAAALIVRVPPWDSASLGDVTIVQVADPLAALHALAAAWRSRFHPLVVGVTGSIAKTSTKEAVAAVLARRFTTLKNEGNQNNEIGLPLTVLELGPEHEAAVLEMGMYVGGEIADLARIARPKIGVVTAVQPVHLSRIGTIEAVEKAKGELVEALPVDGTAVLNADDPRVTRMAGRTGARSITYGFARDAIVTAESIESAGAAGMRFVLRSGPVRCPAAIPTLGRHAVHNALAAAATGLVAGLTPDEIVAGLAAIPTPPRRGELIEASGVVLLDDSYNASPTSVRAALELAASFPGRRIAVLGEMLELGDEHEQGHLSVGQAAAEAVDLLVVVGDGAKAIADGARAAGMSPQHVVLVPDREAAHEYLTPRLRAGDVVLVKASRGVELDLLVDRLAAELRA